MGLPAPRQFRIFAPLGADCKAVTAIEYALLTAIMAMVIVTGVCLFGNNLSGSYSHVSDGLISAGGGATPASSAAAPAGAAAQNAVTPGSSTASTSGSSGQTTQTRMPNPGTQ